MIKPNRKIWTSLLAFLVCLSIISVPALGSRVKAAVGEEPKHTKTITPHGDGTYQLELTVTGDADTHVESAGNVNVVIVYDTSSSMMSQIAGTGQRPTRADQAEAVVYDFVHKLFGYQSSSNPNNIQVALVSFARAGTQREGWTSTEGTITAYFESNGTNGTVNFRNHLPNNQRDTVYDGNGSNGTNWADALADTLALLNDTGTDDDPTFVIMITDGAPTASGETGSNAVSPTGASFATLQGFYEAACESANDIQSLENVTLYGIYAYGSEADLLDDLIYYSNEGEHRASITEASVDTEHYYKTSDTAALNQAIAEIFETIVRALGIDKVEMSDGTTSNVKTTAGVATELLNVDTDSFQYWLEVPTVDNKFTRTSLVSGESTEYTVADNGDGTLTITWTGGSVTVNGKMVTGGFKYEWTEANDLYDQAPPKATFTDGAVDWDLSKIGALLDGVTYSVTFDVWPSQTTLDLIADMKNDPSVYENLDANLKKYIKEDGAGGYTLLTNTETSLKYDDTRDDEGMQETTFNELDPVGTSSTQMLAVSKKWENTLDDRKQQPIDLQVTRDGVVAYEVQLNDANSYTENVFISIGILTVSNDGKVTIKAKGHDYTFKEDGSIAYNWGIDAPTVHPMWIGEDVALLELCGENEEHQIPDSITVSSDTVAKYDIDGETYYQFDGKVYIVVSQDAEAEVSNLTATNYRRSRLYIIKEVDGLAQENKLYTYEIVASNPDESDVWFSIVENPEDDPSEFNYITNTDDTTYVSGDGVKEEVIDGKATGYYYCPSGTTITVKVQKGWSLGFTNIPVGFEFDLTETDDGDGDGTNYVFDKIEATIRHKEKATDTEWIDEDMVKAGAATIKDNNISGQVIDNNQQYEIHVFNKCELEEELIDITVTKVWKGDEDFDVRPEELEITLTAKETGETWKQTVSEETGWKTVFEELHKEVDGKAITYTVDEGKVPAGYAKTITQVDETTFQITNEFTPITYDPPVKKTVSGDSSQADASDTFTFKFEASTEGAPMPEGGESGSMTATIKAGEEHEFGDMYLTEPGTYKYKITEVDEGKEGYTYDTTEYELVFEIGTGEDNELTCKLTVNGEEVDPTAQEAYEFEFVNEYRAYIDVEVEKKWVDADNAAETRPEEVEVTLYANDEAVETVALSEENEWTYTWEELPFSDEDFNEIKYTVKEDNVPEGYKMTSAQSENKVTITNTIKTPETGDANNMALWLSLFGVSMSGTLAAAYVSLKKKNH